MPVAERSTSGGQIMFLYVIRGDRREPTDRRSGRPARFPLKELSGQLVLFDRRYQSDRRLNNISAKIACRRTPGYGHVPGVFVGSTIASV